MSNTEFDIALVTSAFRLAGESGWSKVTVVEAARAAGLSLTEARARFPSRGAILLSFGRLADQAALRDAPSDGPVRDRLFDLLMRRFDMLQTHRAGVKALLRSLPSDPSTALLLAGATERSMRWMLQAAGVPASGTRGAVQVRGLVALWLWAVRAWERDGSDDLSGTMATVDTALQRAEQIAGWLEGRRPGPAPPPVMEGAGELDPSHPPPATGAGAGELDPSHAPPSADSPSMDPPPMDAPKSDPGV